MLTHPEIRFDYTLTFRDFLSGYFLGMRKTSLILWAMMLLGLFVVPLIECFFLCVVLFAWRHGDQTGVRALLPVCSFIFVIPLAYVWQIRTAYGRLLGSEKTALHLSFEADREQFVRRIVGKGEVSWRWDATHAVAANRRLMLIMPCKGAFVMLPHRILSNADRLRLEAIYASARRRLESL